MQYASPGVAELENVAALNRCFVELVAGQSRPPTVSEPLQCALAGLSAPERRRISRLPFLLFTLGGYEPGLWRQCEASPQRDLLKDSSPMPVLEWRLVASTLSLLWILARDNRYSARLVAGAVDEWYSLVGARPIVHVLEFAAGFDHLVVPRLPNERAFWRRLIASCRLPARKSREAARLAAFQRVLTEPDGEGAPRLAAAACRRADASKRFAESLRRI